MDFTTLQNMIAKKPMGKLLDKLASTMIRGSDQKEIIALKAEDIWSKLDSSDAIDFYKSSQERLDKWHEVKNTSGIIQNAVGSSQEIQVIVSQLNMIL